MKIKKIQEAVHHALQLLIYFNWTALALCDYHQ